MAELASKCLFLFLLSLLTICSSGTLVGFSYNARGNTEALSLSRTVSFLRQNKVSASHIRVLVGDPRLLSALSNSSVSVDLYLNESIIRNLIDSKSSATPWLKTQIVTLIPHVKIKSFTLSGSNDLSKLLSTLKSVHSVLSTFHLDNQVKLSVEFSLSFFKNLHGRRLNELQRIFGFVKRTLSSVIIEASIDDCVELGMGDLFIQSIVQKAKFVISLLPCNEVTIVMTIKSLAVPSEKQVAEFASKASKSLESSQNAGKVAELYVEVSPAEMFANKELMREHEQIFPSARREILNDFTITLHDAINPPTVFPTPPVSSPPDTPTPTIVTVPATNPVPVTPANPASTPVAIPNTTPVNIPSTNPSINPAAPITNPTTTPAPITVPGTQPITNPVTAYPPPSGNVPVTNPVAPPATTNAPAVPGQSWCVAKQGTSESALQAALDYACGMGGADCSQIQQGASCYNPNSLQNHASYAFNSYYQKNPAATSCDFGGTATLVNTNPSSGSCIYPSSSSPGTPSVPAPSTTSTNPTTTPSSTSPGVDTSGSGTPPSVLNSSSPSSFYGPEVPPGGNTSASKSASLQPLICCIVLVASFIASMIILEE